MRIEMILYPYGHKWCLKNEIFDVVARKLRTENRFSEGYMEFYRLAIEGGI